MCTAATYKSADFYMGRTLDYEFSYGEEITVMPRRYPLAFRHGGKTESHYALIGMAHVADDYPLYYDAVNEKGLGLDVYKRQALWFVECTSEAMQMNGKKKDCRR